MDEPSPPLDTIPYHRSNLYKDLSEVGDYLAELLYVDRTVDYLRSVDEPSAWTSPAPIVPYDEHTIEVGTTFPFAWTIRLLRPPFDEPPEVQEWGPASADPFDHVVYHIREIKVAAATWGQENLETVTELVEEITWPNSSMYEHGVIMPLGEAHTTLQDDVSTDLGKLGYSIGQWRGQAARNFATNFYHTFNPMRVSQERVFEALVGGLVTAKAIDESSQHSLMTAVHYLREMVREQLELRQQEGNAHQDRREFNPAGSARLISILAGGASVLSVAVGSKLWAIGMEFLAQGMNVAASSIPVTDQLELEGQTAEDLLGTLAEAIRTIKAHAGDQDEKLAAQLGIVLGRVERLLKGPNEEEGEGKLFPNLPQIAEGDVDGGTFRHESSGR